MRREVGLTNPLFGKPVPAQSTVLGRGPPRPALEANWSWCWPWGQRGESPFFTGDQDKRLTACHWPTPGGAPGKGVSARPLPGPRGQSPLFSVVTTKASAASPQPLRVWAVMRNR